MSENQHWLQPYFKDITRDEFETSDFQKRVRFVGKLIVHLGGTFFQYIESPKDISTRNNKNHWFSSTGTNKPLLILPYELESVLDQLNLERSIGEYLNANVKYSDNPLE